MIESDWLNKKAIRAIQDAGFVGPGSVITLNFHQAIELYKIAYNEARRDDLEWPSYEKIKDAARELDIPESSHWMLAFHKGAAWLKAYIEGKRK